MSTMIASLPVSSSHYPGSKEKATYSHIEHVSTTARIVPLRSILPHNFCDMYAPEVLEEPSHVNAVGRPKFTDRALVDWTLNDVRSLLIVCEMRPEWNGQLPLIAECGYRMMYLPLDASNDKIVDTLVSSDIYKEHQFDHKFLVQTAQYTVEAARRRSSAVSSLSSSPVSGDCIMHCEMADESFPHSTPLPLTKPEWRNIIENYLLNLGCEAQCRLDYRRACHQIKRQRQSESKTVESVSPTASSSNSLLKKALLASSSTSPDFPSYLKKQSTTKKVSLTRQEKQLVWVQVQSQLYQRLGLDWEADELV